MHQEPKKASVVQIDTKTGMPIPVPRAFTKKKKQEEDAKKKKGMLNLSDLWNPAMNTVWNSISPFVIGKKLRGKVRPCIYDELFLQGGRACVDGDTLISTPDGDVKIRDFRGGKIYALSTDGNLVTAEACASTRYEAENLYRVKFKSGKSIVCTAEHRFLTKTGWAPVGCLANGDSCLCSSSGCDTSPTSALLREQVFADSQHSYYGESLSVLREDVDHLIRTLVGLIYRCSRDYHLCDERLLAGAETYRDVIQLQADALQHSRDNSHTDVQASFCRYIHSFRYGHLPSTSDYISHAVGECCATSETEIYETLSELLSEIYGAIHKSQTNDSLACTIQEACSLVLETKRWLDYQILLPSEKYIHRVLCDTLLNRIDGQTFSDLISKLDSVVLTRHKYIIFDKVESIEFDRRDCFYDIFVPFYNNYFGNGIVNHNSGKSYFASVIIWLALENDPDKNAVVIRKVGSSLRKSCWKQMMKVRNRLGYYHWEPNKTELTFTNKNTGQQIFLVGLDDEEKVRSITVEVGYISIAWFEEAKQFTSMEEIDQAVSSLLRGGADNEDKDAVRGDMCDEEFGDMEYMTILTYNPPKSQFDWINKEALLGAKKPGRLTHKSTYLTMPKRWLGSKVLNEIENMKKMKPEQYKHMYLGMITGTGGEYFRNITIREITDKEIASFAYFNMGIDWGYNDPNVFLKTYIHDGKLYIFDEIYQDTIPAAGDSKTSKYVEFAKMVKEHTKDCPYNPIYCDAQDKGGMAVFQMAKFKIPVYEAPKHGTNDRDHGYGYLQGLDEIIIDPKRCPNCAKAFPMFESRPAPGGHGWLDAPGMRNDHCPDCVRYAEWENIAYSDRNEDSDYDISALDSILDSDDDESPFESDDESPFDLNDSFDE